MGIETGICGSNPKEKVRTKNVTKKEGYTRHTVLNFLTQIENVQYLNTNYVFDKKNTLPNFNNFTLDINLRLTMDQHILDFLS